MTAYKYIVALGLTVTAFASCKKYVEVDPPITEMVGDQVFNNPKSIEAAMAGLYSRSFKNVAAPGVWDYCLEFYSGMMGDEIYFRLGDFDVYRYNAYSVRNNEIPFWSTGYSNIYQCNAIIEGLEKTTVIAQSLRQQYIGEAKFLRSYFLFAITNLYGDCPIIVTTDVAVTSHLPRSPKADVMKQIIADLTDAAANLAGSTNPKTRATQDAATALLARAYLYAGDNVNAEAKATALITKGTMETSLDNIFLRSSKESIFTITSVDNPRVNFTANGSMTVPAVPTTGNPNYRITAELYNAFELGDQRKVKWIGVSSFGADTWFPYKYKQRSTPSNAAQAEDYVVLRLTEQYLIRAEARAKQNHIKDALDDLKVIRLRAGLGGLDETMSKEDALLAIEKERRVELFYEGGHRWFDLVRTGRADAVLGAMKPTWKSYMALLPVTLAETETNPKLLPNNPKY